MTPYYHDPLVTLYLGDCLDVMRELPDASVDSVITDPPYGLEFMGKEWDQLGATVETVTDTVWPDREPGASLPFGGGGKRVRYGKSAKTMQAWHEQWACEAFRVAKPGAYLLAFGGTRTYHRLAAAIEDAGWEIRDTLMWIYASGFPKSLDVSKALDKAAGVEREPGPISSTWRDTKLDNGQSMNPMRNPSTVTAPATNLAKQWKGWGTALKPAHEPIVMARKPLIGSVASNVTRYGTGALNIDGTRIGMADGHGGGATASESGWFGDEPYEKGSGFVASTQGRWPSNVLLSDPELFDRHNGEVVGSGAVTTMQQTRTDPASKMGRNFGSDTPKGGGGRQEYFGDSGGYSRFFLIPKADRAERERGLNGNGVRANTHPTVKPIDLMRHLVRLVTPPDGICLDPFLGSGTTALAASEMGFRCIGIEKEAEYLKIAEGRLMATPLGMAL